jgi:hypothetical protein
MINLLITNNIPDVNFNETMDKFNPEFTMDLLRGFVLPIGILIIFVIIIINSCKYYSTNYIKGLILNLVIGSVLIILLLKPVLMFQLGEQTIKIFSYIIEGFLKNV